MTLMDEYDTDNEQFEKIKRPERVKMKLKGRKIFHSKDRKKVNRTGNVPSGGMHKRRKKRID